MFTNGLFVSSKGVNFAEILEATHNLRKEQEEEGKLYQSLQEEKQKLLVAEQKFQQERGTHLLRCFLVHLRMPIIYPGHEFDLSKTS